MTTMTTKTTKTTTDKPAYSARKRTLPVIDSTGATGKTVTATLTRYVYDKRGGRIGNTYEAGGMWYRAAKTPESFGPDGKPDKWTDGLALVDRAEVRNRYLAEQRAAEPSAALVKRLYIVGGVPMRLTVQEPDGTEHTDELETPADAMAASAYATAKAAPKAEAQPKEVTAKAAPKAGGLGESAETAKAGALYRELAARVPVAAVVSARAKAATERAATMALRRYAYGLIADNPAEFDGKNVTYKRTKPALAKLAEHIGGVQAAGLRGDYSRAEVVIYPDWGGRNEGATVNCRAYNRDDDERARKVIKCADMTPDSCICPQPAPTWAEVSAALEAYDETMRRARGLARAHEAAALVNAAALVPLGLEDEAIGAAKSNYISPIDAQKLYMSADEITEKQAVADGLLEFVRRPEQPAEAEPAAEQPAEAEQADGEPWEVGKWASAFGLAVKRTTCAVWVIGDTKPHRDELKAHGFRWSAKRGAWWSKAA